MADALTRLGISVPADGDYNWGDVSGGVNSVNMALQSIDQVGFWNNTVSGDNTNNATYNLAGAINGTGTSSIAAGSGGVSTTGSLVVSGGGAFGDSVTVVDKTGSFPGAFIRKPNVAPTNVTPTYSYWYNDQTGTYIDSGKFAITVAGTKGFDLDTSGNLNVTGALSKGSGSFKIDHPVKSDTHFLYHSFVESPYADNNYSGMVELKDGYAEINIDKHFGMSEGTFEALNTTIRRNTSNESGFDRIRSEYENGVLRIYSENKNSSDEIFWELIGERQDQHMKETNWTDENGRVILEVEKEIK